MYDKYDLMFGPNPKVYYRIKDGAMFFNGPKTIDDHINVISETEVHLYRCFDKEWMYSIYKDNDAKSLVDSIRVELRKNDDSDE